MTKVEELVKKAEEKLNSAPTIGSSETTPLQGIGYAILALTEAIREKKVAKDNE